MLLGAGGLQGKVLLGEIIQGCHMKLSTFNCSIFPNKRVFTWKKITISFYSWLRRRWNSSPVVIPGAEEEEYQLTLDDIGSCLVFMYTPVTEEGAKGEPQYAITDYVKAGKRLMITFFLFDVSIILLNFYILYCSLLAAPPSVSNVQITGDAVEGSIIRGVGDYFGGKEGPSKFEWLREDNDTGLVFLLLFVSSIMD